MREDETGIARADIVLATLGVLLAGGVVAPFVLNVSMRVALASVGVLCLVVLVDAFFANPP
ncbi:hypothetical protein [Halarchaeum sp. P4]|uniref:hypothetical protein n=1 Tax=Halarchaeum sp. P4 TaxID=3421639 RepID=UPI003EB7783B